MIRVSASDLADLCRRGDINFRFSSRSSSEEGIRGHRQVQAGRGRDYYPEVALSLQAEVDGTAYEVHGRADGIDLGGGRICVEEIKTIRVDPRDIPGDVSQGFWLQACLYAHIVCLHEQLDGVFVRLCFYDLDSREEHLLEKWFGRDDLCRIFSDALSFHASVSERRRSWQYRRNESLGRAVFPYESFRQGQRDMAVSVFRAVTGDGQVVMQAPTGTGKTMGTLFPAVQALAHVEAQRIMYLTARNPTQALAERAVKDIRQGGAALRSVTITARDRICFSPGEPCDPERCRYARGYYDRVHGAIETLLDEAGEAGGSFDREAVEEAARAHELCPFELGLDLASWSDIIIGDYNYVFDPTVYLRRFFNSDRKDSIVLVDEVHNLVDRGRAMHSAQVVKEHYLGIARRADFSPGVIRAARQVNRAILALRSEDKDLFEERGFIAFREPPPAALVRAMQSFCEHAEVMLRERGEGPAGREELLECYFATGRFLRTAELSDENYVLLLEKQGGRHCLKLSCIDPSRRLNERFSAMASAVCFSATLQPTAYFRRLLGLSEESPWYRVGSPFPKENLQVTVASYVDTSWRGRQQSLDEVLDLVETMTRARTGNYLVFFPSHDYMQAAADRYLLKCPDRHVIVQDRSMDDDERQAFLSAFEDGPVCGFAVMGGIFSEGIDLKGDRLIGVMVVGVGLPQLGPERDLVRDHFTDQGFDFAYRYPGLVRVMQTAGRVIRDADDRGVICLVDRRFAEQKNLELLPEQWQPVNCRNRQEVSLQMNEFWRSSETDPAGKALQVHLR